MRGARVILSPRITLRRRPELATNRENKTDEPVRWPVKQSQNISSQLSLFFFLLLNFYILLLWPWRRRWRRSIYVLTFLFPLLSFFLRLIRIIQNDRSFPSRVSSRLASPRSDCCPSSFLSSSNMYGHPSASAFAGVLLNSGRCLSFSWLLLSPKRYWLSRRFTSVAAWKMLPSQMSEQAKVMHHAIENPLDKLITLEIYKQMRCSNDANNSPNKCISDCWGITLARLRTMFFVLFFCMSNILWRLFATYWSSCYYC